jgi:hypothetical protein
VKSSRSEALAALIGRQMQHPDVRTLFRDLFGGGSSEPETIAALVERCVESVAGRVAHGLFAAISVGGVFGVETRSGERMVVKVYPRRFPRSTLERILGVQQRFASDGFPAPRVRGGLIAVKRSLYASLSDYVEGGIGDGHDPKVREQLAGWLGEFTQRARRDPVGQIVNPFQVATPRRLWPTPHKSTIRLAETARGAGFLRDRARRARSVLARRRFALELAHLDWGIKNAAFARRRLVAVFDWDSLGWQPEVVMVGQAAAAFTACWDIPTKITPSPAEANAFVSEYEARRGRRFTKAERAAVAAAADYLIAVVGRQEWGEGADGPNTFVQLCRELGQRSLLG